MGSATSLGCESLQPSIAESHPHPTYFIHPKTPSRHGYHWRRPSHRNLGLPFATRTLTRSASYSDQHRESDSCANIPIEPLYPPRFAHGIMTLSLNRNTLVILHHLDNCIGFCMFLCVIGFPGIWSVDSCCVRLVSLPYVVRSLVVHGAMCAEMLMNSPNYESTLSLVHLSTM